MPPQARTGAAADARLQGGGEEKGGFNGILKTLAMFFAMQAGESSLRTLQNDTQLRTVKL